MSAATYSYLTFKATRAPQLVSSSLPLQQAILLAAELYEASRLLSNHNLLATGVSIIVMKDDDALEAIKLGTLPLIPGRNIVYQCGGF